MHPFLKFVCFDFSIIGSASNCLGEEWGDFTDYNLDKAGHKLQLIGSKILKQPRSGTD